LNLKMIDVCQGRLIWAIEQVWDSTDKQVELRMKRFYKNELTNLIKKNSDLKVDKIPTKTIITQNRMNNTGLVGVQKIVRQNPGGSVYRAFRVNWTDSKGISRTKFFSIDKLGEKAAFKSAKNYRIEKLLENYYDSR